MRFFILSFFLIISIGTTSSAQLSSDSLPSVFLIGENEKAYNEMLSARPDLLMSVCNDNMEEAYSKWLNFLLEVEKFALENEVDINGIKIWINVFWNPDGTLKHIAFYPKPNSRNMEYEYIRVLFTQFAASYSSDVTNDNIFCHYGSASFPSFITSSTKVDK